MASNHSVRVRFAPSPTGYLHIGGLHTALFNWLYARHTGGQFILRVEDTDRARFTEAALDDFMAGLRWLGLQWDEGPEVGGPHAPYFQSQRATIYREYAQWLVEHDHAYPCYCTKERLAAVNEEHRARKEPDGYDRHCRNLTLAERLQKESEGLTHVIRLKMPLEGSVSFHDAIRGDITFQAANLPVDPVLVKSDGFALYHLAAMVDDHLMEVTHVMRADEWLSSTPIHVLLYQYFGWEAPIFAHLPLILNPNGKGKLSKRKGHERGEGGIPINARDFAADGYLPEAVQNWLTLIGWNYDGQTEVVTREMAVAKFDYQDVTPAPGAAPYSKLEWLNGIYIRNLSIADLTQRLLPFLSAGLNIPEEMLRNDPRMPALVGMVQERIKRLTEATDYLDFAFKPVEPPLVELAGKKIGAAEAGTALGHVIETVSALDPWKPAKLEEELRSLSDTLAIKVGTLFGVIRVALSGKTITPPLFDMMAVLGKEETLKRLQAALEQLKAAA